MSTTVDLHFSLPSTLRNMEAFSYLTGIIYSSLNIYLCQKVKLWIMYLFNVFMPLQWIRTEAFMQKDSKYHKFFFMHVQVLQFGNRVKFQSFYSVKILTPALAFFQTFIKLHEYSILFIIHPFEVNLFSKYYRLIQFLNQSKWFINELVWSQDSRLKKMAIIYYWAFANWFLF